jgi:hypothetical protein
MDQLDDLERDWTTAGNCWGQKAEPFYREHNIENGMERNNAEKQMAPQVGLEPTTLRLTAGCSAIELLRSGRYVVFNKIAQI